MPRFFDDNRAVSPVLGAVLLFGFLVILGSMYQANIVPNQNAEIEFDAYIEGSLDLTVLRNDITTAAFRGGSTTTVIQTGVEYPNRWFAVNPPAAAGELETSDTRSITFNNLRAVDGEARNTRLFWEDNRTYENVTRGIVYTPDFNEINMHSVVVTGESVSRVSETSLIPLTGQSLIEKDRINLIFIDGELEARGQTTSIVTEPLSTSVRTVTVTGTDTTEPIVILLDSPPRMTASQWVAEYGDGLETNERVEGVSVTNDQIELQLNSTRTFQLRLAKVEVRAENEPSVLELPDPAYIVTHSGDDQVVTVGQRATVIAEVRDEYNNPVGDTEVEFTITDGDAQFLNNAGTPIGGSRTLTTGSDGLVTTKLITQSSDDDVVVNASIVGKSGELASTEFDIQIAAGEGSVGGAGAFLASFSRSEPAGPNNQYGAKFELRNLDDDRTMYISGVRVDRASTDANHLRVTGGMSDPWNYQIRIQQPPDETADEIRYRNPTSGTGTVSFGTMMQLDSQFGDGVAEVPPRERAGIILWRFSDGGNPVDMRGAFIEVTIEFYMEDGDPGDPVDVTATLILF